MIPDSRPRPRAWLTVALLWFTVFSNYFARMLPNSMHGSLVAAIPMTEAQFGLLTAVLLWTYGILSPLAGFLADRFSRSRVIIASMILWSVVTWLTSFARTFEQLLILRGLIGVSEAAYMPAALALISDYHTGPTRSLATGIHLTGYVIGLGLSGAGGWLAEQSSWHATFSFVGLACMAYSVPLAFLLRDPPRSRPAESAGAPPTATKVAPGRALASLCASPAFLLVFSTMAMLNLTGWTVIAWLPVFLKEQFHLSQGVAGLSATGYMNAASVPGMFLGGWWADRWASGRPRGRMYVTAIGLFLSAPGIFLTAHTGLFSFAILGLVAHRFTGTFYEVNLMPVLCEVVDRRYRATGYGLVNMVGSIIGGFGIYYSGVLRDMAIDLHNIFDINGVTCIICGLIFFCIKPKIGSASAT